MYCNWMLFRVHYIRGVYWCWMSIRLIEIFKSYKSLDLIYSEAVLPPSFCFTDIYLRYVSPSRPLPCAPPKNQIGPKGSWVIRCPKEIREAPAGSFTTPATTASGTARCSAKDSASSPTANWVLITSKPATTIKIEVQHRSTCLWVIGRLKIKRPPSKKKNSHSVCDPIGQRCRLPIFAFISLDSRNVSVTLVNLNLNDLSTLGLEWTSTCSWYF